MILPTIAELRVDALMPDREIRLVVKSAIEDGISYWCKKIEPIEADHVIAERSTTNADFVSNLLLAGRSVKVSYIDPSRDSGKLMTKIMDISTLYNGLAKFIGARGGVDVETRQWSTSNIEFTGKTANIIFQLALFERVEYA